MHSILLGLIFDKVKAYGRMVGRIGPMMRQIDWFGDRSTVGEILEANVGHPIVTNGEFSA